MFGFFKKQKTNSPVYNENSKKRIESGKIIKIYIIKNLKTTNRN